MTRWTLAAAAAAVLLTAAPGAPRAQSSDLGPLVDRLERLERDIRTLSRQVATGDSAPLVSGETPGAANLSADPAAVARLNVRIDALEGDLRSVTGRIEEVLHEVNRVSQ
ncbi:MAG: hypothetical protein KDE22_18640, partial [Rhodobacterales bacterium]|nr:hypothetical protein [Rhodobacterales bacterium]